MESWKSMEMIQIKKPIRYMHLQSSAWIRDGEKWPILGGTLPGLKKMIFLIKSSFWKWPVLISCQNLKILDSSEGEPMKATECQRDLWKIHPSEMVTAFCKPVKYLDPFCTTKRITTICSHPSGTEGLKKVLLHRTHTTSCKRLRLWLLQKNRHASWNMSMYRPFMSLHHGVTSVWHLQKGLDKRNNNKRCHGVMEIHGDDTNPKPIRYMHLQSSAWIRNGKKWPILGGTLSGLKKRIF